MDYRATFQVEMQLELQINLDSEDQLVCVCVCLQLVFGENYPEVAPLQHRERNRQTEKV